VVDVSDPPEEMARKLRASAQVIWTMGSSAAILPVFNKADLVSPEDDADGDGLLIEVLEDCLAMLGGKDGRGAGGEASGSRTAGSLVSGMLAALSDDGAGPPGGQIPEGGNTDAADDDEAAESSGRRTILRPLLVSAMTGRNMPGLLTAIEEATSPEDTATLRMDPGWNWRGMVSLLHDRDDVAVEETTEGEGGVLVRVRCEGVGLAKALKSLRTKYGDSPEVVSQEGPDEDDGSEPSVDE
jgi:hypothetical protein